MYKRQGLSSAQASAIASAFLEELESLIGQPPMVYTSAYDASHMLDSSVARWPLWAADYGPSQPHVTANWTSWAGFQYTDRGTVSGVSGYVDRDSFTAEIFLSEAPAPAADTYTAVSYTHLARRRAPPPPSATGRAIRWIPTTGRRPSRSASWTSPRGRI